MTSNILSLVMLMVSGVSLDAEEAPEPREGPRRPIGHDGPARHGRDQPAAGGPGRPRRPQAGRQRRRRGHRHQRRPRAHGADVAAASAATCSPSSGTPRRKSSTASTPAAARRTRPRASTSPSKGLTEIPGDGPAELVGARLRRWLGRAAQALRHDAARRAARAEHPLRRGGLPRVTEVIAGYWRAPATQLLRKTPDAARTYLVDGERPRAGEVFKNPGPGAHLPRHRRGRPRCLLQGPHRQGDRRLLGQSTAACSALKDFADHTSTWVEPVSTTYRGYDVWEIAAAGPGHRRAADAQPARRLRPEEDGARRRPTTGTCSSKPRSWPTPTAPASTPIPSSPRCRWPS